MGGGQVVCREGFLWLIYFRRLQYLETATDRWLWEGGRQMPKLVQRADKSNSVPSIATQHVRKFSHIGRLHPPTLLVGFSNCGIRTSAVLTPRYHQEENSIIRFHIG